MENFCIAATKCYGVIRLRSVLVFAILLCMPLAQAAKTYQKPADFLKLEFKNKPPKASFITISTEMQKRISKMNGYSYRQSRVRYWSQGSVTVWILEDIGKTLPITTAYVVKAGKIQQVKVLIYRESHGTEVARPFFTNQLKKVSIKTNLRLSMRPRNIAGATLSVRSLTRMARVALYLDQQRKTK